LRVLFKLAFQSSADQKTSQGKNNKDYNDHI